MKELLILASSLSHSLSLSLSLFALSLFLSPSLSPTECTSYQFSKRNLQLTTLTPGQMERYLPPSSRPHASLEISPLKMPQESLAAISSTKRLLLAKGPSETPDTHDHQSGLLSGSDRAAAEASRTTAAASNVGPPMDFREQHRLVLSTALQDEEENRRLKYRIKKTVQEERQHAMERVRTIRVFNLKHEVNASLVAEWFSKFGSLLSVRLIPSWNCREGDGANKHSGVAEVEFADPDFVDALEQRQGIRVDGSGKCRFSSVLGKANQIKFQRYIPRTVRKQQAEDDLLLFQSTGFQMGNFVGSHKAVYGFELRAITDMGLSAEGLTWELQYLGNRFRFELAFKHVRGKVSVQPVEGGRAALLLPIRIPPKIFRLPLSQPTVEASRLAAAAGLLASATSSAEVSSSPFDLFNWDSPLPQDSAIQAAPGGRPNQQSWRPLRSSSDRAAPQSDSTGPSEAGQQTQWTIDPDKWMRTTDFTPVGAVGSSFLYRFMLPYTIEELEGEHSNLLAPLWNAGILSEPALSRGPEDARQEFDEGWNDLVDDMLAALPYIVWYHLECLLTSGCLCRQQLNIEFMSLLTDSRLPEEVVVQALSLMIAGRRRCDNPITELRRLLQEIMHEKRALHDLARPLPDYCMMVGRALVTPTRVVCIPPETELSNRVLRNYKQHSDRFIRVSFGEENSSILHLGPRANANVDLKERMEQILGSGITIAGRHFDFLAFSTSQLKEHSTWFFAPVAELTADKVRDWMGDFQGIKCVAKYAARMGQCFSSTLDTVEVLENEKVNIPDIKRGIYTFSDGCGLISKELADSVADYLKQHGRLNPTVKTNPCAYQLRYGGCKGVVGVYASLPASTGLPALTGRKIMVRPSMEKFTAEARKIEVVGFARYLPAFLNRQIISILFQKSLGVPDRVFQELQDDMLTTLSSMLTSGESALHVLKDYASDESEGIVNGISVMISAGFSVVDEPYLRGLLTAIRAHLLQDLRNKTRIYVPEAALLMGVMDELGLLEYGQVFIQIDRSPLLDSPEMVTGDVIVAKNPCFHPGDVKCLKAVAVPELQHLRNVVVFPKKGPRPHPNEISGSDLDGDHYFCSWRRNLIPPVRTARPMEFPPPTPKELDKDVLISDVAEFFVDHAISNNLGIIANAHLAMSDSSREGVFDPRCTALAELHSRAVDFPKTGVVVEVPRELRPTRFPDFMQNKQKEAYASQTIIGRLYREIKEPAVQEVFPAQNDNKSFDDDLLVSGYQNYLDQAQRHRVEYEQQLIMVMNQFNVLDEFQLITGCIVQWDKMHRRRNGKRFDTKTHIVEAVQALRRKYLRIFETELQEEQPDEGIRKLHSMQKASAWYYVTYHPACIARGSDSQVPLYSFAWVVDRYLADMKQAKRDPYRGRQRE